MCMSLQDALQLFLKLLFRMCMHLHDLVENGRNINPQTFSRLSMTDRLARTLTLKRLDLEQYEKQYICLNKI